MGFKRFTIPSEETVEDAGDDLVGQIVQSYGVQKNGGNGQRRRYH